jgi:predicted nucleic acid-binding protein
MSLWVADAGPLIFLAKLDRLDLLARAGDDIRVPKAVMAEIRAKADESCMRIEAATHTWLNVQDVKNREAVNLLLADLDLGESEVIALASELKAHKVLLDDLDARRFARRVGLSMVGTVGILLAARLKNEIPSLKEELERLQTYGFRISKPLLDEVLLAANEE